jgi:protein involved in polysaccharide export with SLBB domain
LIKLQTSSQSFIRVAIQAILCLTLLSSVSLGQEDGPRPSPSRIKTRDDGPTAQTSRGPQVVIAADDDYRLAPSDVVEVVIEDAPELSGNYRINRSGTLPMKYLGALQVSGKTTEDVTTIITEGLRGRYLRDPKVYVSVKQYNSRTFFIQGAIKNPGVFVIEGKPSLFKLISIAGGMPENHGSTAYIIREKKVDPAKMEKARAGMPAEGDEKKNVPATGADSNDANRPTIPTPASRALEDVKSGITAIDGETEYELLTANISGFYRGRFEQNLIIQPNDLVYIPPSEVFFVVGEVKSPGQFTLREGSSIRQAISLSQGLLFKAAGDRALIFRQDPATGKLTEIPLDIGAIMNGKKDDVLLAPNDVVMIPNSKMKAFAGTMMMSMGVAMAQTAILGIMR